MDAALPWVALGVSLAGLVVSILWLPLPAPGTETGSDNERSVSRVALRAGAVMVLLLWAATLPARPPWAPGSAMGLGFLMGATSALLAIALMRHLRGRVVGGTQEPTPAALQAAGLFAAVGILSLAVLPLSVAPLLFTDGILDALGGIALGAVLVALLGRLALGLGSQVAEGIQDGALLQGWAAFTATLAGAIAFGYYHFPPSEGAGRVVPLGMAALLILATAASAGLFPNHRSPARAFAATGLLGAVVVGMLAVVTLPRLVGEAGDTGCVLLGIGTGILCALLAAASARSEGGPYWRETAGIAAFMVVGLYAVAFQWLQGFGVGLALMGAWVIGAPGLAALAWHDLAAASAAHRRQPIPEDGSRLAAAAAEGHQVLAVALLALLFRLFLERYRPLATDLSLTLHFTLVGAVVGAIAPALFAGVVERSALNCRLMGSPAPSAARRGLWLAGGIAFWSAGVPAAVGVAWGMRSLVGLLAGLLVAGIYTLLTPPVKGSGTRGVAALAGLLGAILMALVVVQMGHLLAPLGVLHRGIRVTVLGVAAALALAGLVASAYAGPRGPALRVEEGTSPDHA